MADNKEKSNIEILQRRVYKMVSVGIIDEPINQAYDVITTIALILNLAVTIMDTFDNLHASFGAVFHAVEAVTIFLFAVDYVLRVFSAKFLYPDYDSRRSAVKYMISFSGIIDLLSFLPYYLPIFFPAGAAAFRMFRVARILRLFRINAYYDSLNVITEVLVSKKQQLLSSVFIILVLMLGSSLCMYSVENAAQPDIFSNAFSGIWWSASTLLTVGYGDIYPVTTMGKFLGICITFLGVGMVAIPTGIISAGFVEQYQRLKRIGDYAVEEDIHFITVHMKKKDNWVGKRIMELGLPQDVIIAAIHRGRETIVPRGDVVIKENDRVILGAASLKDDKPVNIQEIILRRNHPWNGLAIKNLDISRQSFILMVKRHDKMVIPRGDLILTEGDEIILYSMGNEV